MRSEKSYFLSKTTPFTSLLKNNVEELVHVRRAVSAEVVRLAAVLFLHHQLFERRVGASLDLLEIVDYQLVSHDFEVDFLLLDRFLHLY